MLWKTPEKTKSKFLNQFIQRVTESKKQPVSPEEEEVSSLWNLEGYRPSRFVRKFFTRKTKTKKETKVSSKVLGI